MKLFKLIFLLVLITNSTLFAQIEFESGYYITNINDTVRCQIKNKDWINTPQKITVLKGNEEAVIDDCIEFSVAGRFFKKYKVSLAINAGSRPKVSDSREPDFVEKDLFLEKLYNGEISLLKYRNGTSNLFFIKHSNSDTLEQLIYKKYRSGPERIIENKLYQEQLKSIIPTANIYDIINLEYSESDIISVLVKYFGKNKLKPEADTSKNNNGNLHLSIKIGLNIRSASIVNRGLFLDKKYETTNTILVGVELEWTMNFNKGKFRLFLDPYYSYYDANHTDNYYLNKYFPSINNRESIIKYHSIDIPIGVRYYSFMKKDKAQQIFFALGVVPTVTIEGYMQLDKNDEKTKYELSPLFNYMIGVGYVYNKFSFEFRYNTDRNLFTTNEDFVSEFNGVSFNLGYKLF
ncbi:hypothetical protein [Flammeovirga sp. SJP92]|uniref:hypothetical protein n=1 Tax=Flammeovirga sp. SJP92 TaxID=1775430 RepID=UPI000788FF24|nr:hypothetical protein [Flammeovirga sp. SJP92]KXX70692.1 hypothetical protein AVL50_07705 [Flammeovirga sp. SJP92]